MRADRVHARQAQHAPACRCRRASSRPTRPVLPPCGTMRRAGRGAGLAPRRPPLRRARAHHGQRLAARALAPVLLPGGQVAFGQHVGIADDGAQLSSRSVHAVSVTSDSVGRGCRPGVPQAQPHVHRAGDEQHRHSATSSGQRAAHGRVSLPGAHHAFGEIQPHHQADPAVGVHAVFQQARPAAGTAAAPSAPASEPPGRSGASHSSQASPSTIRPSRLPTASQRVGAPTAGGTAGWSSAVSPAWAWRWHACASADAHDTGA